VYPGSGDIAADRVQSVKDSVLSCVTAVHSAGSCYTDNGGQSYPHLRTLLTFDTGELLNVLALAFSDLSVDKKQRIVDILLLIMVDGSGYTPTQVTHQPARLLAESGLVFCWCFCF